MLANMGKNDDVLNLDFCRTLVPLPHEILVSNGEKHDLGECVAL